MTGDLMTIVAVVDDSEIELEILANSLRAEGISCIGIAHPEDALTIISEAKPDLIVLDIHMPKINGIDLCKQLRLNDSTRDIPIIILSSDQSRDSIVASLHLGVIDYIPKGCAMKTIVQAVKQHDLINKLHQAWEPAKIELERIIRKYGGHDNVQLWAKEQRKNAGYRWVTDRDCEPCPKNKQS